MEILSSMWFQSILKLLLGFILAGIIGMERTSWNKPAGFRTHALVGISAVLTMICGEYMASKYNIDPSRIPAQLLSGIGFIGAGTILRDGFNVKGLTTASGLLGVTCVGLSIGAGYYFIGIIATIIMYLVLSYSYILTGKLDHFDEFDIEITINEEDEEKEKTMNEIEKIINKSNIMIKKIDVKKVEDSEEKVIEIVGKYNKKDINHGKILSKLVSIENVIKVEEVE